MFTQYSEINSKRTCQDVLNILTQGSVRTNGVSAPSVSSSHGNRSDDSGTLSEPFDSDPDAFGERWTALPSTNQRKPGLRLGLKRVVMKTLGDEPPNKKEKASIPLPDGTRCFSVLFAKPQTKKNKTWENDGYLVFKNSYLTLKNHQGEIVTCGRLVNQILEDGNQFSVGDKIVQVQEEVFEMPSAMA